MVGVRVRPLNDREREAGGPPPPLRFEKKAIVDPEAEKTWKFDYVWGQETVNETIFTNIALNIVSGVLEGYNGTIFAYGQTSSVSQLYL